MTIRLVLIDEFKVINDEMADRLKAGRPFDVVIDENGDVKVVDVMEPPRMIQ